MMSGSNYHVTYLQILETERRLKLCHVCIDFLSIDKDFLFDEDSQPELKFIRLTDRGGLKYPSEFILYNNFMEDFDSD